MSQIAHISDLHFGRTIPHLVEALIERLNADAPDLVAVSGDLTQRARRRELAAARAFLDALASPWLAVPGNHDLPLWNPWDRFARPWRLWQRYVGPETMPSRGGADFVAVGVNTARRWGSWLDWSRGRIDRAQAGEAARILAQAPPGALRVLVAHHPFLPHAGDRRGGPIGGARAGLACLMGIDLDLILGGHVHRGYAGLVRVGDAAGPVAVQAGTALSDRLRGEVNGYNRIRLARHDLEIEMLRWTPGGFAVAHRARYRKSAAGWGSSPLE